MGSKDAKEWCLALSIATAIVVLSACAAESGIAPAGQDTYLASRSGAFYVPITDLKAQVLRQVGDFCDKRSMTFSVISSSNTQPPYVPGNNPEVDVQFKCVSHETDK